MVIAFLETTVTASKAKQSLMSYIFKQITSKQVLDKLVLDPDRGSAPTRDYFQAVLLRIFGQDCFKSEVKEISHVFKSSMRLYTSGTTIGVVIVAVSIPPMIALPIGA